MFGENYKNVFAIQDSYIHIPINQPERSHWNFALILTGRKTIIVHDPMYTESRVASIGECLFSFVKREAGDDLTLMTDWEIKTSIKHPQQSDQCNCGVFTLVSSIRAMCLVKQNRIGELFKTWNFPAAADDIMDYRKSFAKIVLNDDRESEFAKFVKMFSLT
jgi:Ulp1 family protease